MEAHTSRALKKQRKIKRQEALVAIRALDDHQLKNMLNELGKEFAKRCELVNEVRARVDAVRSEQERRATLTSVGVHISDHAVVRYLERVRGLNMHEIREEIVVMAQRAGKLGSGEQYARRVDDESGMTLGVNEITNTVTTIFNDSERDIIAVD